MLPPQTISIYQHLVTFLNKSFAAKLHRSPAAPTSAPLLVGVPLGTNKSTTDVAATNNIHLPTFGNFAK
jgi:hypothetical protein